MNPATILLRRLLLPILATLTLTGVAVASVASADAVTPQQAALVQAHAQAKGISLAQARAELDHFFWSLSHPAPAPADGPAAAWVALRRAGASEQVARQLVAICQRESHCRLRAHHYSHRTRDDSWGPWQTNYYGALRAGRTALLGSGAFITSTWDRAARAVLTLSNQGRNLCPWRRSCYS